MPIAAARRSAPVAVAAACLLWAPSAAGASPQLTDPAGDWVLAGSDVLAVTLDVARDRRGRSSALLVALELAAPPAEATPVIYTVRMQYGECQDLSLKLFWSGGLPELESSSERHLEECGLRAPDLPVKAVVGGSRITWRVALADGLRSGVVIEGLTAATTPGGRRGKGAGSITSGTPAGDRTATGSPYVVR